MSAGDLFLKTLKRIGYNEADFLDEYDFTSVLSQEELKPFFEIFCTLSENNVLTNEEIEEYAALTSAELAEIEVFKKSGQFEKNEDEQEKKKEVCFLEEQLTLIENQNKTLLRRIDLFKKHEENLLQEKEVQEKFLLKAKKRFKTYEINKVPKFEEEFISNLKSSLENAEDIQSLIHSDSSENKLPTSNVFKHLVQQYLETEEKILLCINTYMQTNFQQEENGNLSFIQKEILHNEELKKEALFLKKKLKSNIVDNITSEMEVHKTEAMVKYFETLAVSDISCPASQLRQKIDEEIKRNEQLKLKEEEYKSYMYDSISKHVEALVTQIALCVAVETFNHFQSGTEKISLPKKCLVHQRLRIEMLIATLFEVKSKFIKLKELIQEISKKINEEQLFVQERQIQIEKELSNNAKKEAEQDPEITVVSSLYKILTTSKDFKAQDMPTVSITDLADKTSKIFETEANINRMQEEDMKTIDQLEKHASSLESLLCADKKYCNWRELHQSWNSSLNNLAVKLTSLEGSLSECNADIDQKHKLLEKRRNLQLARKLYVYALMNPELFKKHIDDIKVAIENSSDYRS